MEDCTAALGALRMRRGDTIVKLLVQVRRRVHIRTPNI